MAVVTVTVLWSHFYLVTFRNNYYLIFLYFRVLCSCRYLLNLYMSVSPTIMIWILNVPPCHQPVALLRSGESFKIPGVVGGSYIIGVCPEGNVGTLVLFSGFYLHGSFEVSSFALPRAPCHAALLYHGPQNNVAVQPWTEISETISQNKSLLLLSCLSLAFCHFDRKLTNTPPLDYEFHNYQRCL
jgi:hypothetical protein